MAQLRTLTAESAREQASAGLDQLSEGESANFQRLNDAYRARFGFPFIICARLNAKDAIVSAMQTRMSNSPDVEFQQALAEVEKIAWLRLQDLESTL
jgi:2-oxo-4-hydroxy-4-carboxy-5-ureidoimidazoline decarboxylase